MSLPSLAAQSIASKSERPLRDVPIGEVVCGDCLPLLEALPARCCDLIYVDPPFPSGKLRSGGVSAVKASIPHESRDLDRYLEFLQPRLAAMHRLLTDRGSLFVHLNWRCVHYVKVVLDDIFGSQQFLNEIIWHYHSGSRAGRWFARKHDSILWYVRQAGRHTFHAPRGGAYRTKDMRYDEQGRPFKSTRKGRLYFHPDGPAIPDVWDIPFLSTVAKSRTGHPFQKPEALLERIIQACSDEGDVVADFFCGSGTTLAVAQRLGRRWLGCETNPDYVAMTNQRLSDPKARPAPMARSEAPKRGAKRPCSTGL